MLNQDTILNALKAVKYPGYSRDIVSFGLVKNIAANNGAVSVSIELTSANKDAAEQLKQTCEQVIRALPDGRGKPHAKCAKRSTHRRKLCLSSAAFATSA